ncbi:MAG: DUF2214 family protein [Saprospiraceae bacterium]|nr:DUF2214 family protein [Saprospiraceae bacterium]
MELELFFRYLHFVCIIGIAGAITSEHLLLKPSMSRKEINRLSKIDLVYGVSILVLVGAGLALWLWVGKPADFYSKNWVFHLKFTLVIILSLFSLPPTLFFLKNRKGNPEEIVEVPGKIKMFIRLELLMLLIIPLLAVIMARGIGFFG